MSTEEPIRVLIVDDHRLVADALARVLGTQTDIRVIGTVGAVGALRALDVEAPDVVLMDYMLSDGTGSEATHLVKARWARARIIMVTGVTDPSVLVETIQAGADGYVTKDRALDEVVQAVRDAHRGHLDLTPAALLEITSRLGEARRDEPPARQLTTRELDVLRALATGKSTGGIALELGIGEGTVRTHVESLRRKLGAKSRLEAVARAVRLGIVSRSS